MHKVESVTHKMSNPVTAYELARIRDRCALLENSTYTKGDFLCVAATVWPAIYQALRHISPKHCLHAITQHYQQLQHAAGTAQHIRVLPGDLRRMIMQYFYTVHRDSFGNSRLIALTYFGLPVPGLPNRVVYADGAAVRAEFKNYPHRGMVINRISVNFETIRVVFVGYIPPNMRFVRVNSEEDSYHVHVSTAYNSFNVMSHADHAEWMRQFQNGLAKFEKIALS